MRQYIYLFFLIFLLSFTSCLKGNLDELPEFEENEITGIQKVEYRYVSNDISGASGQPIVKYVTLGREVRMNTEGKHVGIKVTVPAAGNAFPASERAKCTTANIAVMVSLSTAARIAPIGGAPQLGIPGDWSKPNTYKVTAANGDTKEWVIEVTGFVK